MILVLTLATLIAPTFPPARASDMCERPMAPDPRLAISQKILTGLRERLNFPTGTTLIRVELTRASPPLSRAEPGILVSVKNKSDLPRVAALIAEITEGTGVFAEVVHNRKIGPGKPLM